MARAREPDRRRPEHTFDGDSAFALGMMFRCRLGTGATRRAIRWSRRFGPAGSVSSARGPGGRPRCGGWPPRSAEQIGATLSGGSSCDRSHGSSGRGRRRLRAASAIRRTSCTEAPRPRQQRRGGVEHHTRAGGLALQHTSHSGRSARHHRRKGLRPSPGRPNPPIQIEACHSAVRHSTPCEPVVKPPARRRHAPPTRLRTSIARDRAPECQLGPRTPRPAATPQPGW